MFHGKSESFAGESSGITPFSTTETSNSGMKMTTTTTTTPTPRRSIGSSYDDKDDEVTCFKEAQQGFLRGQKNSNRNNDRNATPKTLFTSNISDNDRGSLSDRRMLMMTPSPTLSSCNSSSRQKYRQRKRSSSRRSSSSNNSNLSQSLLLNHENDPNIRTPLSVRQRSSKQSGSISSYKRRSSCQSKKRPTQGAM